MGKGEILKAENRNKNQKSDAGGWKRAFLAKNRSFSHLTGQTWPFCFKGRVVTGKGRVVTGKGRVVTGKGRVVIGKGRVVIGKGRVVIGKGRVVIGNDRRPTFKENPEIGALQPRVSGAIQPGNRQPKFLAWPMLQN